MLRSIQMEAANLLKKTAEETSAAIMERLERIPLYKKWFVSGYGVEVDNTLERDLVNFPHPTRREYPVKVKYGFIPEDWFTRFYNKTGVTGPYALATGVSSYLLSKEIYVLEHNYYNGISMAILCVLVVKQLGPTLALYLDGELDEEIHEWNKNKDDQLNVYKEAIEWEKKAQESVKAQTMLIDAKHQMVAAQLEAAFRERQMEVYTEVVRRLNYMVAVSRARTNLLLRYMSTWVEDNVSEQLKKDPELSQRVIKHCIAQLRAIMPQHENHHEGTPAPEDDGGPETATPGTEEEPAAAATVNMWGVPVLT